MVKVNSIKKNVVINGLRYNATEIFISFSWLFSPLKQLLILLVWFMKFWQIQAKLYCKLNLLKVKCNFDIKFMINFIYFSFSNFNYNLPEVDLFLSRFMYTSMAGWKPCPRCPAGKLPDATRGISWGGCVLGTYSWCDVYIVTTKAVITV